MDPLSTSSAYWTNWHVLLCCLVMLTTTTISLFIIKKYEGAKGVRNGNHEDDDDDDDMGVLYEDEIWNTYWKQIRPIWLIGYRIVSFIVLLAIIIVNSVLRGGTTFCYYTEWTFALVTTYFGYGSVLSIYGFYHKVGVVRNEELGQSRPRQVAGISGYVFQIMYQILAGAVVLTDGVYWTIIVPYITTKTTTKLDLLGTCLHSLNIIFFLGDAILNNLRFPWFRVAYFGLWTGSFVVFQWILHAITPTWWPYIFLDLKGSLSPLWYFLMALFHIPCYGGFFLVIKLKHFVRTKLS